MPELPTGTITFLFTDIEGSTKRWEAQPDAMRTALARHDALLRAAITNHNGAVFKALSLTACSSMMVRQSRTGGKIPSLGFRYAASCGPLPGSKPRIGVHVPRGRPRLSTGADEDRNALEWAMR